ncbi:hypothetical protein CASFOL_009334 [Castilleja foliolosa]|uniref:Transcription initiation factor TFIID subunit 8 n=1 Tax=Castilleja foliolosa TaxID=1961234 RepID=A0ABD3DX17_9LAMI
MSDGGKSEGKIDEPDDSIIRSGTGNYSRAIARTAVAQVCESIGFVGFNESALDSLADIAIRYLCDLGKASRFYTNLSGRTECNVFDIAQGLEDLCLPIGFRGSSDIYTDCKVNSGAIREIEDYVKTSDEIPFAQPLQRFPVIRDRIMIPSFLQMDETPCFKHLPAWLPAFPDPHTYIRTPVWNERVSDPHTDKIELARQHRKAERSLLSLQQRLLCNGSSMATTSSDLYAGKTDNPFLANPLQAGERDVSSVCLPAKLPVEMHTEKHVSLLETFAPALEAMKDGLDSGSDEEKIVPVKRASVFLEFKSGKKVFGEPLDLRIRNRALGKTTSWFGREDERDDKKRRVEFILRQSLENQQELPQL